MTLAEGKAILARLPQMVELSVALIVVAAVILMILPMPTLLVDLFVSFNLGVALLLLATAIYLKRPLDLSTLPGVILISTIFRLALSVTTTRLILSEGDAGAIVRTFGEFVVAGNVVVGLVIFLIITVVQLMVISKGAERVAEVGARFTLDAMPGKQMAIDADLRNGDIEQSEARARRRELERESQLYGAMDGAMKFVKGDAIAGIVIIAVNLIGGFLIGTAQRGLGVAEALREYTLLSVGDALISQIPALLLSITAATIVTRVAGETDRNLGADIVSQISADQKALWIAGGLLLLLGLLPGFPLGALATIATGFFVLAALRFQAERASRMRPHTDGDAHDASAAGPTLQQADDPAAGGRLRLVVSEALAGDGAAIEQAGRAAAGRVGAALGIQLPEPITVCDKNLAPPEWHVELDGVPLGEEIAAPDRWLVPEDPGLLEAAGLPHEISDAGPTVDAGVAERARSLGFEVLSPSERVSRRTEAILRRHVGAFLGIDEARALLSAMEKEQPELTKEVARVVSIQRLADVLRRLVDEGVAVRHRRAVFEALAEWAEKEADVVNLTEYVRGALKRQISHANAGPGRVIPALMMEREAEETVRGALRQTAVGSYLVLDDRTSELLLGQVRKALASEAQAVRPVVLSSMDIRRYLRALLSRNGVEIAVMSYQELDPGYTTLPVGAIRLGPRSSARGPREAAATATQSAAAE